MPRSLRPLSLIAASALFFTCTLALAQAGRFDLTGPKLDVRVTRGNRMLPIASVPNLQPGDKLWLHPDLPASQSVHYLLIVTFLRGTTNPPPDNWFTKIETWNRKIREEGVTVTVPQEAQQAILFLAPETGGDFGTLRSAVRGRPGTFVRASQDLAEAGFEQARIEKYLASMRQVPPSDPKALLDHSNLLARTLNLKPNEDCFRRPIDMQFNCLTQTGSQTLLDDGHGQTVVASLTNGAGSDFITAASATSMAGGGVYSAYVGAVVDLVRLTSGLHTAQYQYIPAIAFPQDASLNLRLNTPPSFHNPKSVIVIGLPAIQSAVPPPLRPADPKQITCLLKPQIVLPVEGAPLVFSTAFAHDMVLRINGPGSSPPIPLVADAFRGGLVLASQPERKLLPEDSSPTPMPAPKPAVSPAAASGAVTGTIYGEWGFDPFTGPTLLLQQTPGKDWKLVDSEPIIAGRENHLQITSSASACVESITLESNTGSSVEAKWKPAGTPSDPNLIDVTLPLKSPDPGALHIAIHQYGVTDAAMLSAKTFSEPATLTALELHAGDTSAILEGKSLDQVQQMSLEKLDKPQKSEKLTFTPVATAPASESGVATANPETRLQLSLPPSTPAPKLKPGERLTASFSLKDGRLLTLPVTVLPERPIVTLLGKNATGATVSPIRLGSPDDFPANSQITFSLHSNASFPRDGKIEIATPDGSLEHTLSVAAGTLVLQNHHTLLATLDPLKVFGPSAFGPLRLRAIAPDGTPGDWLPLATIVRLPTLTDMLCSDDTSASCTLEGSSLYLLDSVADNEAFTAPTTIPEGFVDSTINIPRPTALGASVPSQHPVTTLLFLRLRDDPTVVDSITLPVLPVQPALSAKTAQPKPGPSHPHKSAPAKPADPTPVESPEPPPTTAVTQPVTATPAPAAAPASPSVEPANQKPPR